MHLHIAPLDESKNDAAAVTMARGNTPELKVEMLIGDGRWNDFAQRWDTCLRGDHLALTHRFLSCARHLQMEGFEMMPLVLTGEHGIAIGVASCFQSHADAADLGGPGLRRAVTAVRRVLPGFLRYRVIEIGLPAGVGFPARVPDSKAFGIVIASVMEQASKMRNTLVLVRDVDPETAPDSEAELRRKGFMSLPMPATMLVPLPLGSFEDYKQGMRAKYRALMKARLKKTEALSCEVVNDFSALVPELIELWRNLYGRAARYHRLVVTPQFLTSVSKLDESRALLLRRKDGSIAAFGLMYLDGETLRGTVGGFTKEAAVDEGVYFRMLYETVRFAADNGFRAAALGQSTAGPKMSIGAVPIPLTAWIWRPSRIGRWILSRLIGTLMRPEPPPPPRNVFTNPIVSLRDAALADFAGSNVTGTSESN